VKEVIVTAPYQFEVTEKEIPKPEKGEVLVQMKAAGVCGSDFHLFLGENPQAVFPRVPGHENAGIIAEVGEGVTSVKKGDHVVVDLVIACGECKQCRSGRRNICETVKARGAAADGGWREYFTVPEHEVYVLPEDMPFEEAALIEPFAIGGHCTKRADVTKEDLVLIYGSGTIGAVVLQTCKNIGCKVICADINESSLERAERYGADHIIHSGQEDLIDRISRITKGKGVDVVFDCACYPGSLTYLMKQGILTNGGRIVPLGFCTEQEQITQAMINGRELEIIGTRMSTGQFEPTITKLTNHEYQLEGMVSHYIPFTEIDKVFDNMKNPPSDMKKMVILW
jgi:2-desacetyl-2-hydroxyethyl bacteriochlorophyllide A dehydrogenase